GAAAVGYGLASRDGDSTEASGAAASEEPASPDATADDATADGDTTDDAATATDTDEGTETDDAATAADGDAADANAEGTSEDGTETVTVEVDPAEGEDADADADAGTDDAGDADGALNDGDRQAVFRDGKVYLSGAVPSEEVGAAIVAKAEAVVGPGNVINEYTIDPTTTIQPGSSAPLFVEDVVLFEFNSVEVASPFLPILDLGTLLLRQNPQASITVVTRTDAVGSAEVNLEVARQRAQAVVNYWLGQGVNADQIIADPRGEEGASEEDDPETAALQRRAEFIITGLLD
ncbi:MAG: OmpA family protein, partial [Actinomycetota bacterium]